MKECYSGKFNLFIVIVLTLAISYSIVNATGISEQDKTYISSAGGYLKTQNEQGTKVAVTMDGLNNGSSTLDDVREVIKQARFVTNAGWHGDYLRNGKLVVPTTFQKTDKKIRESHNLREKAYDEYLKYWKDEKTYHIESGHRIFKNSEVIAQDATRELTKLMQDMNKGK